MVDSSSKMSFLTSNRTCDQYCLRQCTWHIWIHYKRHTNRERQRGKERETSNYATGMSFLLVSLLLSSSCLWREKQKHKRNIFCLSFDLSSLVRREKKKHVEESNQRLIDMSIRITNNEWSWSLLSHTSRLFIFFFVFLVSSRKKESKEKKKKKNTKDRERERGKKGNNGG